MTATLTPALAPVPHLFNKGRYRRPSIAGVCIYDVSGVWMAVSTSAGRDWEGSCYSRVRGWIAKAKGGGYLALTMAAADGKSWREAICEAVHFPTMLRAYSHIRPVANRRRDFAR